MFKLMVKKIIAILRKSFLLTWPYDLSLMNWSITCIFFVHVIFSAFFVCTEYKYRLRRARKPDFVACKHQRCKLPAHPGSLISALFIYDTANVGTRIKILCKLDIGMVEWVC